MRRLFCLCVGFFVIYYLSSQSAYSQGMTEILLYGNTNESNIRGSEVKTSEVKTYDVKGDLTHLSGMVTPRLLFYRPDKACGTGIIICPGGGYSKLNVENTKFIANRLTKMGVSVFVLVYRLPANDSSSDKTTAALQDVQTAFRTVRHRASEWGLSADKIGLWGSSAGGHLAAMAATHWSKSYVPGIDTSGLRPDFLILAWPVISFRQGLVHQGSMKNLLGGKPTEEQIADYSPDECVNSKTPPTFLVHASDDTTVPSGNSIIFYEALKRAKVPAELHIYEKGGHGFGIAPEVVDSWLGQLEIWLKNRGLH